jgi:hypothetical protein
MTQLKMNPVAIAAVQMNGLDSSPTEVTQIEMTSWRCWK